MRVGPSGASNKSARHSLIKFTARNPQVIEQPGALGKLLVKVNALIPQADLPFV
jgi:hypothetical protein